MPAPATSPTPTSTVAASLTPAPASCSCGSVARTSVVDVTDRARRLVALDRAVAAGHVTTSEAAERRAQLLAR